MRAFAAAQLLYHVRAHAMYSYTLCKSRRKKFWHFDAWLSHITACCCRPPYWRTHPSSPRRGNFFSQGWKMWQRRAERERESFKLPLQPRRRKIIRRKMYLTERIPAGGVRSRTHLSAAQPPACVNPHSCAEAAWLETQSKTNSDRWPGRMRKVLVANLLHSSQTWFLTFFKVIWFCPLCTELNWSRTSIDHY